VSWFRKNPAAAPPVEPAMTEPPAAVPEPEAILGSPALAAPPPAEPEPEPSAPVLPGDERISVGADAIAPVCELVDAHLSAVVSETEDAAVGFIERSHEIDGAVTDLGERVATLVGHAERQSTSVADLGERTARMVDELTGFVMDRNTAVQALVEEMRRLDGFSDRIRNIAEATNMLALNAMIEAARAGREGAGFGVVAHEVKRLSQESDAAAKEFGTRIGDLTTRINDALSLGADAAKGPGADGLEERLAAIATNQDELLSTFTGTVDEMSGAVAAVRDTADALAERSTGLAGGVQFQDIARQAIEHVQQTVRRVGDHTAALGEYARGEIDADVLAGRQTSLDDMPDSYVMRQQRATHASVADGGPGVDAHEAPVIELF
jgi:methyl-accepting chemotaxis protein